MIDEILKLKREKKLSKDVKEIINMVTEIAISAGKTQEEKGIRLAAAFDLLASAEYHNAVTNRGWTYCDEEKQMMLYAYTNICPKCIGEKKRFVFTKANKPESAQIGMVSTELLCQMMEYIFQKENKNIEVYKASEPIDAIVYDKKNKNLIIAEVKSSPMMTIPLAVYCDKMTENTPDGILVESKHGLMDNPFMKSSRIGLFFPYVNDGLREWVVPLNIDWNNEKPFYDALLTLLSDNHNFFDKYFEYWSVAYNAYAKKDKDISLFWLTNGCGQPVPRPSNWPARKGTGYESVSDGKTSVGMDRTDDIKKAIYQVLKLGTQYKINGDNIKTAIISNIHAIRHYDDYLLTVRDVIWAFDDNGNATLAKELEPNTPLFNLFDGIISFTKSDIRDSWIREIYKVGGIN